MLSASKLQFLGDSFVQVIIHIALALAWIEGLHLSSHSLQSLGLPLAPNGCRHQWNPESRSPKTNDA